MIIAEGRGRPRKAAQGCRGRPRKAAEGPRKDSRKDRGRLQKTIAFIRDCIYLYLEAGLTEKEAMPLKSAPDSEPCRSCPDWLFVPSVKPSVSLDSLGRIFCIIQLYLVQVSRASLLNSSELVSQFTFKV